MMLCGSIGRVAELPPRLTTLKDFSPFFQIQKFRIALPIHIREGV